MALLRISAALAVGLMCGTANAQERESPFGGGPIVYGGDHRASYVAMSAVGAQDQDSTEATAAPASPEPRGGRAGGRGGRGRGGRGGRGGPGGAGSGRN